MTQEEKITRLPSQEIDFIKNENKALRAALVEAEEKIDWYKNQFQLAQQRRFSTSEESHHSLQSELFNADDGLLDGKQPPEEPEVSAELSTELPQKKKGRERGKKNSDLSSLPHQRVVHDLTEAEKTCGCGKTMHCIGEDTVSKVETIPAQYYVIEHVHPKYACRGCEAVQSAKRPNDSPLQKSIATASLLAEIISDKYHYHLPLYRQAKRFAAKGLAISESSLGSWVMSSSDALILLESAYWDCLLQSPYLQVDETPVKVLKPEKKAYMWCYLAPTLGKKGLIIFDFNLSRAAKIVEHRLQNYQGALQTDGYSGYNSLRKQQGVEAFGCWTHARRKFIEIVKLTQKKKGKAADAVEQIDALYHLETEAKERGLNASERQAFRQQHAAPRVAQFKVWLLATLPNVPPKSLLGAAIGYALNQWAYLERYLQNGLVEMDTNWVENQIRPFAVGRRSWLFVGNTQSAERGALLYSLVQSCLLNDLNPQQYLHFVLSQTHQLRRGEVDPKTLLPHLIDPAVVEAFSHQHYLKAMELFQKNTSA